MKNSSVFGLIVGIVTMTGMAASTQAQQNPIYTNIFSTIDPDFNSGHVAGVGQGENAVVTNVQSAIGFRFGPADLRLTATYRISGYWGDPTANNPYYSYMESYGRHTSSSYTLGRFTGGDGTEYEFENLIHMSLMGSSWLFRNDEHTNMSGVSYLDVMMTGAVPHMEYVTITTMNEADRPNFIIDFEITAIITEQYRQVSVPTPGVASLAGLGTLFFAARRRR